MLPVVLFIYKLNFNCMEEIQKQVVKVALKKLFTQKHFSICVIDKCLKVTQIIANETDYNTMSALHCINYSDMSKDIQDWLLKTVKEMFMGNRFDLSFLETRKDIKIETIDAILIEEKPKRTGFSRLLG